ncbi:MAG: B12-binding domain-containing radical SAM protein [Planctomycetes bacterium]|nr:B12-binding domain-containing radical SAM protein [Planctomycetota bacterium]
MSKPSYTNPVVLLEHPRPEDPESFQDVVNAPLSANLMTPYISAVLKSQQIPVETLDANLLDLSMDDTLEELAKRQPKLLGVHMVYLWDKTAEVFEMLSRLSEILPDTHINLFGFYPTFSYRKILQQFPFIDSVTMGEPEYTFLELSKVISGNTLNPNLSAIDGLAFRPKDASNGHEIVTNRQRPLISDLDLDIDLDGLPFPDRSDMEQRKKRRVTTYVLGSRGCYNHCTFCYINPYYANMDNGANGTDAQNSTSIWRGRSAENVFEEILELYTEHGIRYLYFADANFFGPGRQGKRRALQLADLMIKNKLDITFGLECRANDVEEESLSRLVQAGLREVFLGVESGSQRVLDRFKKNLTTETNERAVKLLRRYGIEPSLGFIMFHPDARLGDIRNNFEFLKRTELLRTPAVTAHILHHGQTFFRGTPDFHQSVERPGTTLEPFTGYEAFCGVTDAGVAAFAEVAAELCRAVLDMLGLEDADVCNADVTGGRLVDLNRAIISGYDRLLALFEDAGTQAADAATKDARLLCREILSDISHAYEPAGGNSYR